VSEKPATDDRAGHEHDQSRTEGLRRGAGNAAQRPPDGDVRHPFPLGTCSYAFLKAFPDLRLNGRDAFVERSLGLGEPGEIERNEREDAGPADAEHVAVGRMQRIHGSAEAFAPLRQAVARGASGDAQRPRDIDHRHLFEVVHDEHEARAGIRDRLDKVIHEAAMLPAGDPLDQAGVPTIAGKILRFVGEQLAMTSSELAVSGRGVVGNLEDPRHEIDGGVAGVQLLRNTEKDLLREVRLIRLGDA
jgi:hypothetical protein